MDFVTGLPLVHPKCLLVLYLCLAFLGFLLDEHGDLNHKSWILHWALRHGDIGMQIGSTI